MASHKFERVGQKVRSGVLTCNGENEGGLKGRACEVEGIGPERAQSWRIYYGVAWICFLYVSRISVPSQELGRDRDWDNDWERDSLFELRRFAVTDSGEQARAVLAISQLGPLVGSVLYASRLSKRTIRHWIPHADCVLERHIVTPFSEQLSELHKGAPDPSQPTLPPHSK